MLKLTVADWIQRFKGTYIRHNGFWKYVGGVTVEHLPNMRENVEYSDVLLYLTEIGNRRGSWVKCGDQSAFDFSLPDCGFYNTRKNTALVSRMLVKQFKRSAYEGNLTITPVYVRYVDEVVNFIDPVRMDVSLSGSKAFESLLAGERYAAAFSRKHLLFKHPRREKAFVLGNNISALGIVEQSGVVTPINPLVSQEISDVIKYNKLPMVLA